MLWQNTSRGRVYPATVQRIARFPGVLVPLQVECLRSLEFSADPQLYAYLRPSKPYVPASASVLLKNRVFLLVPNVVNMYYLSAEKHKSKFPMCHDMQS